MDEFNMYKRKYVRFLKTIPSDLKMEDGKKNIGVLVCPWLGTPLPWFAITLALILKKLSNCNVSIIVNDLWFRKGYSVPYSYNPKHTKIILKVLSKYKILFQNLNIIYLSQIDIKGIKLSNKDYEIIEKIADLNTIRQFLNSFMSDSTLQKEAFNNWKNIFTSFFPYIKSSIQMKDWDQFIIPSGVFCESGLFCEELKRQRVKMITYDAGYFVIYLGINGLAGRNDNIDDTIALITENSLREKACEEAKRTFYVRKKGMEDIGAAMAGKIIQKKLPIGKNEKQKYDIVIFMNIENEVSALGTHKVFANDKEWILKTIKYFLENTDYTIAVREHPMQPAWGQPKVEDEIQKIGINDRLTFIPCDAEINSYDLIDNSKVVVVCTSTIGLEAGMCGKRVVLESECYYGKASFVSQANTEEEYYTYIEQLVHNPVPLSEDEIKEAELYYYLSQQCSGIKTNFSPQPDQFMKWTKRTFDDLLNDVAINKIVKSIIEEVPLCYLLFKEKWNY